MLLADASVWIDHLRAADDRLAEALRDGEIIIHPFVIGEIALGSLKDRPRLVRELTRLSRAVLASHDEVMALIDRHLLFGRGIGYVDAHLIASVLLTPGARLWTRDRRLHAAADTIGIAAQMAVE